MCSICRPIRRPKISTKCVTRAGISSRARPQWWQQHGENIQSIVEVAAKLASIHHLRQITIRGSHQPNIHLVSPGATQALELLFLQYTQQFGLQRRRNIAHLVQKERAFVGQLETSNLLRDGSGECAFLVAKKLTFQQIQRNGSAIQSHERASAARAEVVNRVCDQFLAGACFSLDKNRGISRRDPFNLFEHRFQSRTVAYDLLESALIRNLTHDSRVSAKAPTENLLARVLQFVIGAQLSRAARTLPSRASSSNGFARNSTAPALNACIRIFVSPCAVMKMVGILQCSAFSLACNSSPDIPGMRISAIRHAVWCC